MHIFSFTVSNVINTFDVWLSWSEHLFSTTHRKCRHSTGSTHTIQEHLISPL